MKRFFETIFILSFCFIFSCKGNDYVAEEQVPQVNLDSIKYALNVFWNRTSCQGPFSNRMEAMNIIQRAADSCSNLQFNQYLSSTDSKKCREIENSGILYYFKSAFDKVNKEIRETKVEKGTIVIWQLYNMGYIIKTPTHCFGIDIKHKYGHLLADKIDFLLITHHHEDHYTNEIIERMMELGKPVVSNFINNSYKISGSKELKFDDITVLTNLADHNKSLLNFVVTYEIDCGSSTNNFTIFHIGDTYNASQLKIKGKVDLFIPHLAVGLDMQKAVEIVQPKEVFMSHILELGHAVNKWRWSYQYGINECNKLKWHNVWLPVWGEKIIFKK